MKKTWLFFVAYLLLCSNSIYSFSCKDCYTQLKKNQGCKKVGQCDRTGDGGIDCKCLNIQWNCIGNTDGTRWVCG